MVENKIKNVKIIDLLVQPIPLPSPAQRNR
jgi:hypothetical protein